MSLVVSERTLHKIYHAWGSHTAPTSLRDALGMVASDLRQLVAALWFRCGCTSLRLCTAPCVYPEDVTFSQVPSGPPAYMFHGGYVVDIVAGCPAFRMFIPSMLCLDQYTNASKRNTRDGMTPRHDEFAAPSSEALQCKC